jgi:hypothetical protein
MNSRIRPGERHAYVVAHYCNSAFVRRRWRLLRILPLGANRIYIIKSVQPMSWGGWDFDFARWFCWLNSNWNWSNLQHALRRWIGSFRKRPERMMPANDSRRFRESVQLPHCPDRCGGQCQRVWKRAKAIRLDGDRSRGVHHWRQTEVAGHQQAGQQVLTKTFRSGRTQRIATATQAGSWSERVARATASADAPECGRRRFGQQARSHGLDSLM